MIVAHRGANYALSEPVRITRENPIRKFDLVMRKGVTVHGRVLKPDGSPAAGIKFEHVFSPTAGHGYSASDRHTDRLGRFRFENVVPDLPGKYRINITENPGFRDHTQLFEPNGKELVIRLQAGREVTGQVIDDATGWPIPGIEVYALPTPYSGNRSTYVNAAERTDRHGRFHFNTMDEHGYEIGVRSGSIVNHPVKVKGGQSAQPVVRVKLAEWSKLKPVKPAQAADARP